ncbi:hydroxymethylglutaryl-CoA lyase [Evansella sp. AB-P1]|uniref:hydroxymethylglutaryl-CoA lyase n=1 Tax=Evansella sp. AB-P1 TaxID=3037653 RepID=UPI00241C9481|nr:hydroxymethylglutaryl-CoA lyase [Evansella sp. AB-P1]MDG5786373.1 hydroxymethylglutaryl-CoA lyase [Evansella sp. AB-P1]
MKIPHFIHVKEVGPRDGLQNEKQFISTDKKIEWINLLSSSGLSYIEVTSFVHQKWIPALADAMEVAKGIKRKEGVTYAALVPNRIGLERALEADMDEVSIFMSATETHNLKNINKSIDETFPILDEVIKDAIASGKKVRGYVSTVFGCPYEGAVPIERVKRIADRLFSMGIYELSLGDTIGIANPVQMNQVLMELLKSLPPTSIALHLHDTRGMSLANTLVGLSNGISTFDSSCGGLGGCPYAKGASGNIASEDFIYMLDAMGCETEIDFEKLLRASRYIQSLFSKSLPSHQLGLNVKGG